MWWVNAQSVYGGRRFGFNFRSQFQGPNGGTAPPHEDLLPTNIILPHLVRCVNFCKSLPSLSAMCWVLGVG